MYILLFWFNISHVISGAIIRDGDRKRAPFLVLVVSPWYGTIFLFLEQIAPSPSTHARTCCKDLCGCHKQEMVSKIPEIVYAFGPQLQLNAFMSVGLRLAKIRTMAKLAWYAIEAFQKVTIRYKYWYCCQKINKHERGHVCSTSSNRYHRRDNGTFTSILSFNCTIHRPSDSVQCFCKISKPWNF